MNTEKQGEIHMALLRSEQEAKDFVDRIGTKRATRLLCAITARIKRRIDIGNRGAVGFRYDEYSIRVTELERTLMYQLKMGLTLLDTYNTPVAAKKRILERIAKRNEKERRRKARTFWRAVVNAEQVLHIDFFSKRGYFICKCKPN